MRLMNARHRKDVYKLKIFCFEIRKIGRRFISTKGERGLCFKVVNTTGRDRL